MMRRSIEDQQRLTMEVFFEQQSQDWNESVGFEWRRRTGMEGGQDWNGARNGMEVEGWNGAGFWN